MASPSVGTTSRGSLWRKIAEPGTHYLFLFVTSPVPYSKPPGVGLKDCRRTPPFSWPLVKPRELDGPNLLGNETEIQTR